MIYAIVEHTTGKIVQSGVASDLECLSPMLQENQVAIEIDSTVDNTKFVVIDGRLEQLPERPSPAHTFDYTTKQWIDPRTEQTQWPVVRSQRNALLSASDWTQLPDIPASTRAAWAPYRQALRDITEQADPFNIVWPVAPG